MEDEPPSPCTEGWQGHRATMSPPAKMFCDSREVLPEEINGSGIRSTRSSRGSRALRAEPKQFLQPVPECLETFYRANVLHAGQQVDGTQFLLVRTVTRRERHHRE